MNTSNLIVPPIAPITPVGSPAGVLSIGLVRGGSDPPDVAIEDVTRSIYVHALIVCPDGSVWESLPNGGVQHNASVETQHAGASIDYFTMPLTDGQVAAIIGFCEANKGAPYSWKGDIAFVTAGDNQADPQPGAFFCSELVFAAFLAAAITLLKNIQAWMVPPGMLRLPTLLNGPIQSQAAERAAAYQRKKITMIHNPLNCRLGRQPTRRDPRTLRLAGRIETLAPPPISVDWTKAVNSWPMLMNDNLGDCTIAAALHMEQCWRANCGNNLVVTDAEALAAYEAIAGYNPADPTSDDGANELDVLKAWRNSQAGIGGRNILGFMAVNPQNIVEVKQAIYLFGGIYTGAGLPLSAQDQDVWDVVQGAGSQAGSWGGHAIPGEAYDPDGLTCITWGETQRMTWAWWLAYVEEAYAVLSKDWVRAGLAGAASGLAPSGFDLATLQADLARLSA